eukprot:FR736719.1.p1 GENE.FR736719.1~~FR736719.1.p1  ORF type:complete len:292 (+),score=16.34 FR736719.1:3-878(+)
MVKEGQLIQVNRIQAEWCYGIVVWQPSEETEQAVSGDDSEVINGVELRQTAGWFPSEYTEPPSLEQMDAYQAEQGGAGAVSENLKPPEYWQAAKTAVEDEQVGARLHDLRETDEEYEQLSTQFQATIHGMRPDNTPQLNNVRILKIQRIENLQLWQSYAAKKASMLLRAKKEGIDPIEYERSYLWHGTNAGVVENIYQQGFNRIFNGVNATLYGKGVYFARDSGYSYAYCQPAQRNEPFLMFACRIMAGEFCVGKKDQPVPDERIPAHKTLFDSDTSECKGDKPKYVRDLS